MVFPSQAIGSIVYRLSSCELGALGFFLVMGFRDLGCFSSATCLTPLSKPLEASIRSEHMTSAFTGRGQELKLLLMLPPSLRCYVDPGTSFCQFLFHLA